MTITLKPLRLNVDGGLEEQAAISLLQSDVASQRILGPLGINPNVSSGDYTSLLNFYNQSNTILGSTGKLKTTETSIGVKSFSDLILENGNNDLVRLGNSTFQHNGDNIAIEKDSSWLTPTYLNGFSDGYAPLRYRKIGKWVILNGIANRSVSDVVMDNVVVANLPVGFRPLAAVWTISIVVGTALSPVSMRVHQGAIGPDGNLNRGVGTIRTGTAFATSNTHFNSIFRVD